jgi:hypothetical protein
VTAPAHSAAALLLGLVDDKPQVPTPAPVAAPAPAPAPAQSHRPRYRRNRHKPRPAPDAFEREPDGQDTALFGPGERTKVLSKIRL